MTTLHITVGNREQLREDALQFVQDVEADNLDEQEGKATLQFGTYDDFVDSLTPLRLELIRAIAEEAPEGMSEAARLVERVRSRISVSYRVRFDRYGEDTIAEILERRAREGLGPNAASDEVFETIARLADGDARMGITTLRAAARKAISEGLSNIPR